MTLGTDDKGCAYITLSPNQKKEFFMGIPVSSIKNSAEGSYKITLKMEVKHLNDKFGRSLKLGDKVVIPDPDATKGDAWNFGNFIATVKKYKNDKIISVEDADGDYWDVEAYRTEKYYEEV